MDARSTKQLSADELRRFRRRLLAWYRRNRRELPWRKSRDPYGVWISEIMLQQTQVATVRDYFSRFLNVFPTVDILAAADEAEVLRLWEGLGYYRRARQIHAAAQQVVANHGGHFPQGVAALRELPGIGRYTAGAIASIAFDERAPIVEANTARLFARLVGFRKELATASGQRLLWETAETLLPRRGAGEFNQALMELGSLVCSPDRPVCEECPVVALCAAHTAGLVNQIPQKKRPQETIAVRETAVVVVRRGRVLLRKCADGERWAGLWDFPRFPIESPLSIEKAASVGHKPAESATNSQCSPASHLLSTIQKEVRDQTGVTVRPHTLIKTLKHAVTKYRITLDCVAADYVAGRPRSTRSRPVKWVLCRELSDYPLSTTGRKIAKLQIR